jgi:hypothetical protein
MKTLKFLSVLILCLSLSEAYPQNFWEATNGPCSGPPAQVSSMAINSNDYLFATVCFQGVFRTSDNGEIWVGINNGLTDTLPYAIAINSTDDIFLGTIESGAFRSTDNGENWIQINNGLNTSNILSLAINSNDHIFAGSTSGVYRSTDNGDSWVHINNGLTSTIVLALAINSQGFVFAGTQGGGVYISTNNGGNWVQIINGLTNTFVTSLAINSNDHIFAGTSDGVFRLMNYWGSWLHIGLSAIEVKSLTINSIDHIFTGTDMNGVYRSTNNGDSWIQINSGLIYPEGTSFAINSVGYIFVGNYMGMVYKSIASTSEPILVSSPNGGEAWQQNTLREITWSCNNIEDVRIEYTSNNGISWNTIIESISGSAGSYIWTVPNTPSDFCKVKISDTQNPSVFDESDNCFSIIAEGQILIDGSFTEPGYSLLATKLNSNNGFGEPELTNIYYAMDVDNLFLAFECIVQNQQNLYNELPDGLGVFINFSSQQGRIAGQPLGIDTIYNFHFLNGAIEYPSPFTLDFKADFEVDYLFAVYSNETPDSIIFDASTHVIGSSANIQNIGRTTQSGFMIAGPLSTGVFSAGSIYFAFQPSTGFGCKKGFEVKIPFAELNANSSDSFELFACIVSSTAYFSDETIPGNVLYNNSGFAPDYYNNITNVNCQCPNPEFTIGIAPYHTSTTSLPVELKSFTATYKAGNIILNWTTATESNNQGFEVQRKIRESEFENIGFVPGFGTTTEPKSYSFTESEVSSGKYSYRLKQIDFDGSFGYSDEVEIEVSTPLEFSLVQNYPNPFNPSTKISWQSPVSSRQTLKVYDVLGNEVATLVDEEKPAGSYEIEWDAGKYPSGVYFYQLKTENYFETKKMILLK